MWSQCAHNHISWPRSFTAGVRSTRVEWHIGQCFIDGIRSNANLVNRHTGHSSLSRELFVRSVGRAVTDTFSVAPHDEHPRNDEFKLVDVTFFESLRSKVNTL